LWETRTRGVFSTPPLEMESSIFFFFCVSSEERSFVPFFEFLRQIFHFVSFITFCVCSVFLQNCGQSCCCSHHFSSSSLLQHATTTRTQQQTNNKNTRVKL
jgi:hypothetical protein